jgi:DNA-binding CsgD family transcriptional regulator
MDGIGRKAHFGRSIRDLLGGAAKKLEPIFEKVLSSGASVLNHEYSAELPKRTEEGHWVISCFPIKDKSRRVKLIGAVQIEITNLTRLEIWSHKLLTDSVRLLAPLSESDQLLGQAISNSYSTKSPVKKLRQEKITVREQQVIQLLARSKTNKEVAAALGVSVRTIETHRARIMLKLRIHSLSELVHFAIRSGIVQP